MKDKYLDTLSKYDVNLSDEEIASEVKQIVSENYDANNTIDVLKFSLGCIDLTSLNPTDNEERITEFTKRVRFPLDGIAPGEYIIKLSLIAGTPRGRSTYYDTIVDVSRFIITDDPAVNSGFIWNESIWGEFRLKPLIMEQAIGNRE